MRLTSLILCGILLLSGCGSDEIPTPIEQMPNYFPDAAGSRWVYQNADGAQWTWEVTDERGTHGEGYQVFTYVPPVSGTEFDFLNPDVFRVTQNQVLFVVGEKIARYIQAELPNAVQDEFVGLELNVAVEPLSYPELVFFQFPLRPNAQWDALNVKVSGNIILQNLLLLALPFEVWIRITAEVVEEIPLGTPAGNFETVYRIEYQTEITHTLFSEAETTRQRQTVWFAPHVGIVKIEDERGVTELIAYAL